MRPQWYRLLVYLFLIFTVLSTVAILIYASVTLATQGIRTISFSEETGLDRVFTVVGTIASLLAIGGSLASIGQWVRRRLFRAQDYAQEARLDAIRKNIADLAPKNPELALMLEYLQGTEQQQAEAARRAFRQGVVQNFVFYLLGVVTPIVLIRLHIGV
jgi:hypothetical protein